MKSKAKKLPPTTPVSHKPLWKLVEREKYFIGEDKYIDKTLVTMFPSPFNLPHASLIYKTIHGGFFFAFRYDLTDREPQYEVENRYGNFVLGVNSEKIIEVNFYTRECMGKWILETEYPSQSNEEVIKKIIIENKERL